MLQISSQTTTTLFHPRSSHIQARLVSTVTTVVALYVLSRSIHIQAQPRGRRLIWCLPVNLDRIIAAILDLASTAGRLGAVFRTSLPLLSSARVSSLRPTSLISSQVFYTSTRYLSHSAPTMASSSVSSNSAILAHLSHALLRISRIPPRVIASPPTQPRRASVAILLRVRPTPEDEAWLAQSHDPEAQHDAARAVEANANHDLENSGVHISQASLGHAPNAGVSSLASSMASADLSSTLSSFFELPWVKRGTPEILYIKRAARIGDNWSAHVAFPGGRKEEGDENGLYTAMRETWEEVGIDLAEKEFSCVGQLDDREITTSLGKRLLMVLSPYVFVQTSPFSPLPDLQPSEVASAHWIPLSLLYTPKPKWGTTSVDISSRLAPKSPLVRWVLRALVGKMDFKCILLPNDPVAVAEYDENDDDHVHLLADSAAVGGEKAGSYIARAEQGSIRPELRLWGLTLGMTLDLLSHMTTFSSSSSFRSGAISPTPLEPSSPSRILSTFGSVPPLQDAASSSMPSASELVSSPLVSINRVIGRVRDEFHLNPPPASHALAPSLTSVFPRFSYPDVNFWIWFFGWRYRNVVRGWESSVGTRTERKFNWSGMALGAFYSAVRRALVVAVILRALGTLSAGGIAAWLVGRKVNRSRKGLPGLGLDELLS